MVIWVPATPEDEANEVKVGPNISRSRGGTMLLPLGSKVSFLLPVFIPDGTHTLRLVAEVAVP